MKKTITLLSLVIFSLSACGPSKEEQAIKEKAKMDSVAQATANNIARQQAIQDSIAADAANQEALKEQLINLKAKLEAEQVKLNDTEQFKLLHSKDEKAQQIEEQTKVVEQLKSQIEDIQKQIR